MYSNLLSVSTVSYVFVFAYLFANGSKPLIKNVNIQVMLARRTKATQIVDFAYTYW
jgi:hypothetical protein